jgi:hypothetical protein
MRSASALAARSAASKSISSPVTFLAPSLVLRAPRMLARFGAVVVGFLRMAVEEGARMGVGAGRASEVLATALRPEGDFDRVVPLGGLAVRKGEAVRETTSGVPVREGGLLGRLMVGLSQDEKKSSAGSPAGVDVPSVESAAASSVITTSSG